MNEHNMWVELDSMYAELVRVLKLKGKHKDPSALLCILSVKSNEGYKILADSAINKSSLSRDVFDLIVRRGLAREVNREGQYTLTAKGVWEIEIQKEILSQDILIDKIDSKFFQVFKEGGNLNEKEKVIVLAMLAVRAFSLESALDLKRGNLVLERLHSILLESLALLNRFGIISKLDDNKLFGAPGNEHPVSNVIRHTDALLKKTKGVFITGGQQKYYLDVAPAGALDEERLRDLLEFIIGNSLSESQKESLKSFLRDTAHNEGVYLFDASQHLFARPSYDAIIESIIDYNWI